MRASPRSDGNAVATSARLLDASLRQASAGPTEAEIIDGLVASLSGIDPASIDGDEARIAFWLNVYNALLLQSLAAKPATGSMLLRPRLFTSSGHWIGGCDYSLNDIEHGVLRLNRRPPLSGRRPFRTRDPRVRSMPGLRDPRIHFALNCGARSCPPIRVYSASDLDRELERATVAYLEAETEITPSEIVLPGIMRLYARDFGGRRGGVRFAAARLPELDRPEAGPDPRVRYARFDWTAAAR